ncbi:phage holin family protein [Lachnoclostridium pacaense]|uniref:phage holin family protein n=1 Tax=Enterocloster hominis (ex Hitch et al. 2024) TaxID=1917870 RepID=UPI001D1152DF|nr:phage holin family protein [Lachnoclostridium pacaense]MCC2820638.1 phage holin family protein [Lachnoclostridium pacaense]
MDKVKASFVAAFSVIFGWLGILAVPVLILAGLNFTDYITGILASKRRNERVTSDKGLWGIVKKVGMWILVGLGWAMDVLINYAGQYVGLSIKLPFVVATIVAVWLICNEIISILENLLDIGVAMPPFLMPLARMIKGQVEDKTKMDA